MQAPSSSCNKCMFSACCTDHTFRFSCSILHVYTHGLLLVFSLTNIIRYSLLNSYEIKIEAFCLVQLDCFIPFLLKQCAMKSELANYNVETG
uniref:Uncharacterized protein n=1 Tax=Arundo donax TaxID=35708 RepID=A0A0A9D1V4_ARUDO